MTSTAELSFNNVRVPLSHLVGKENRGFYQVLEFFDESRIEIAAQALESPREPLTGPWPIPRSAASSGRSSPSSGDPAQTRDMATKIETARLIVHKAAWNYDQGAIDPKLTSMAKMYAGRVAVEVADEAIQLHGGYGYMLEYEVERFYRDAKIMEIYEGTKEIQKNTIASALLAKRDSVVS